MSLCDGMFDSVNVSRSTCNVNTPELVSKRDHGRADEGFQGRDQDRRTTLGARRWESKADHTERSLLTTGKYLTICSIRLSWLYLKTQQHPTAEGARAEANAQVRKGIDDPERDTRTRSDNPC